MIALLGIGGCELSEVHTHETARVASAMAPDYLSLLTLTLVPGTPLFEDARAGRFQELEPLGFLSELRQIVAEFAPTRPVIFRTNHASNYVDLAGVLPRDRDRMLARLDQAIEKGRLKPEWLRGL